MLFRILKKDLKRKKYCDHGMDFAVFLPDHNIIIRISIFDFYCNSSDSTKVIVPLSRHSTNL